MESGDPVPWFGRLYREEPEGWIVDKDGVPKYLRRSLGKMVDTPTLDATIAQTWRQEFSQPVVNPATIPRPRRGVVERRRYKDLPPAGSYDAAGPYSPSLLEIRVKGQVVVPGTKEAGIGIKQATVEKIAEGEGTVVVSAPGMQFFWFWFPV